MASWYFSRKGKKRGPLSTEKVLSLIKEKKLGPYDLLFSEADGSWRSITEIPEFTKNYEDEFLKTLDDFWVVLKRSEGSGDFIQSRPLTKDQVLRGISRGKISYSDFIWRKGMKEWYRVSFLSEFNADPKPETLKKAKLPGEPEKLKTEEGDDEKFDNIVLQQKSAVSEQEPEPDPEEADGEDEVYLHLMEITQQKLKEKTSTGIHIKKLLEQEEKEFGPQGDRRRVQRRGKGRQKSGERRVQKRKVSFKDDVIDLWINLRAGFRKTSWGAYIMLFVVLFLVVGAVFLTGVPQTAFKKWQRKNVVNNFEEPKNSQKMRPAPRVSEKNKIGKDKTKANGQVSIKKKVVINAPSKVEINKVKPTYFKVKAVGLDGKNGRIVFKTNGSSHYPVYLNWYGEVGKVTGDWAVFKTNKVYIPKSKELKIAGLGLPEGYLQLTVKCEEFEQTLWLFNGDKGKAFRAKIRAKKKQRAFWVQEERKALISQTSSLAKWAEESEKLLQLKPTASTVKLARSKLIKNQSGYLRKINEKNPLNFAYPKRWIEIRKEFSNLFDDLKRREGDGQITGAILEVRRFYKKMGRQFEAAQNLSLWK